jgi:hypothetical protein
MSRKLLLRVASVLMLLHTMGHSIGAFTWKNTPDTAMKLVVSGMETNHFTFMGRVTTLASYFDGYGFTMIFVLLLITSLLWLISSAESNTLVVGIARLLAVFLIAMGVIEYVYFFPFAAAFSLLAGICTLIALFANKETKLVNI